MVNRGHSRSDLLLAPHLDVACLDFSLGFPVPYLRCDLGHKRFPPIRRSARRIVLGVVRTCQRSKIEGPKLGRFGDKCILLPVIPVAYSECEYKQRWRGGWSGCCQWRLLPREFPPWGTAYHYFRLWRNTTVWVHLYRGEREKPVIRLSSACSQAKLGLDMQAWINRTRWWSAQGSAADTWAQNARLRSCRALRACRYDSWGAIGDHARIFLASVPKRRR